MYRSSQLREGPLPRFFSRSKCLRVLPDRSKRSASTGEGFLSHGLKRPGPSADRTIARRAEAGSLFCSVSPSVSEIVAPVARAHRSMNASVGMRYPASARATTGWVVPMARASSAWVLPDRRLAVARVSPTSDFVTRRLYPKGYIRHANLRHAAVSLSKAVSSVQQLDIERTTVRVKI